MRTPLRFSEPVAEHLATRHYAGLFDFSFMSCFQVSGPQALSFLEHLQTRSLTGLRAGRLLYTLLLREDGSVFIDATLWNLGDGRYWIITGRRSDFSHVGALARGFKVILEDLSGRDSVFAIQGPLSHDIIELLTGGSGLPYFGFRSCRILGVRGMLARAGYSGEAGYEILLDSLQAESVWRRILAYTASLNITECGFEAVDSLRVEAGLILFLRELAYRVTPHMLGLERLIDISGRAFNGSAALARMGASSSALRLVGIAPISSPLPAPDQPSTYGNGILSLDRGRVLITSRVVSPTLGKTLALGFVRAEDAWSGTTVISADGTRVNVARLPFYDPLKSRPRARVLKR